LNKAILNKEVQDFINSNLKSDITKLILKGSAFEEVSIQEIGIRHGEKKYETLVTLEEMVKATDLGGYYSIAADNRDLNYAPYFSEGNKKEALSGEYNSDNTERLNVAQMKALLLQLPERLKTIHP